MRLDNDWLKQANSKNYHHFFPKAWLKKKGYSDREINHIANITLVDDFLNKRVIQAQAPGTYIKKCYHENENLDRTLTSHFIGKPASCGILDNDYKTFFSKRCRKLSSELKKLILPVEADNRMMATPANETVDLGATEEYSEIEASV